MRGMGKYHKYLEYSKRELANMIVRSEAVRDRLRADNRELRMTVKELTEAILELKRKKYERSSRD